MLIKTHSPGFYYTHVADSDAEVAKCGRAVAARYNGVRTGDRDLIYHGCPTCLAHPDVVEARRGRA
jgi:hypothetical protein